MTMLEHLQFSGIVACLLCVGRWARVHNSSSTAPSANFFGPTVHKVATVTIMETEEP